MENAYNNGFNIISTVQFVEKIFYPPKIENKN